MKEGEGEGRLRFRQKTLQRTYKCQDASYVDDAMSMIILRGDGFSDAFGHAAFAASEGQIKKSAPTACSRMKALHPAGVLFVRHFNLDEPAGRGRAPRKRSAVGGGGGERGRRLASVQTNNAEHRLPPLMGYGWISGEEIRSRSTNNSYRKGSAYYKSGAVSSATRGTVIPYAGADKGHDCISAMVREQEPAPRRKGSGEDGSYQVQVYAMGVTRCDCQAESMHVCRHTVAAMLHIVDNLGKIEAESPGGMSPIRGAEGDECGGYYDVSPALFFERRRIEYRGDMKKALASLRFVTEDLGEYPAYYRHEGMRTKKDGRRAARDASKDRARLTAYMSYLQKLMIKHADTPQKKSKYARYLERGFARAYDKFAAKVYEDAMVEMACRGAEWRTYIAKAAEEGVTGRPFYGTGAYPDRYRSLLERIG
ncbi:MAG: hypothetical protein OXK17_00015 [Thaumarchaeota archaeon]|nr:hypothetical protein [Nitrososphaerota archaeon]